MFTDLLLWMIEHRVHGIRIMHEFLLGQENIRVNSCGPSQASELFSLKFEWKLILSNGNVELCERIV
jgi:hypothetical protein